MSRRASKRPRQADALALPAGQVHAGITYPGGVALGQLADEVGGARGAAASSISAWLASGRAKAMFSAIVTSNSSRILPGDRDALAPLERIDLGRADIVDRNRAFLRAAATSSAG